MPKSEHVRCPECDTVMIAAPTPLMRIFGDIRALECPACDYMLLSYSFRPAPAEPAIVLRLDAAE